MTSRSPEQQEPHVPDELISIDSQTLFFPPRTETLEILSARIPVAALLDQVVEIQGRELRFVKGHGRADEVLWELLIYLFSQSGVEADFDALKGHEKLRHLMKLSKMVSRRVGALASEAESRELRIGLGRESTLTTWVVTTNPKRFLPVGHSGRSGAEIQLPQWPFHPSREILALATRVGLNHVALVALSSDLPTLKALLGPALEAAHEFPLEVDSRPSLPG